MDHGRWAHGGCAWRGEPRPADAPGAAGRSGPRAAARGLSGSPMTSGHRTVECRRRTPAACRLPTHLVGQADPLDQAGKHSRARRDGGDIDVLARAVVEAADRAEPIE